MTEPDFFDYLGTAEDIAKLLPELAQFDTPENAAVSPSMVRSIALMNSMTQKQFLISCAVALTFNLQTVPADNTLDDVSDEYLRAHPDMQKQLEDVVSRIEDLSEGMKG